MSVLACVLGGYALYHCFSIIFTETAYAFVLFGMTIPNLMGDYHIAFWLYNDTKENRDSLVSGAGLNLIGCAGQTLWEILDHHSFKHWWDDRIELMLILIRGISLCLLCYYYMIISERYEEIKYRRRNLDD